MSRRLPRDRPGGGELIPIWWIVLLVLGALSILSRVLGLPETITFGLSAAGIIPLAGLIGRSTEDLAHHIGPRWGGLLNATFGNAAELIIAGFALGRGLTELVKASITGSIVGNLLLILGFSLFLGGIRYGTQRFDAKEAGRNSAMMLIALTALVLPALFALAEPDHFVVEEVSVGVAIVLLATYFAFIYYSLRTAPEASDRGKAVSEPAGGSVEESGWSTRTAGIVLLGATIGTVVLSETLVGTIEGVTRSIGLSEFFVGIILVPIVGNVAEHLSAVQLAMKNRLDVSQAIAAGSSTQVALLVAPLLVLLGLAIGHPLDLVFSPLEIAIVAAAAGLFAYISLDGESNWLEGFELLGVYVMAAVVFFFLRAH